jgi:hypothetical protein
MKYKKQFNFFNTLVNFFRHFKKKIILYKINININSMTTGIGNPYGYNKSLAADAAAAAADAVSDAKAAAADAEAAAANAATAAAHAALKATPHVPLTKAEFDAPYAHIECPSCRKFAIGMCNPAYNYKEKCTHKKAKATGHVKLTKEEYDAQYDHIKCLSCRRTAINFGEPSYNKECTHKKGEKGGSKKKSRRLRRGKSKSKFQRRGKSIKRQRRY